VEEIPIETDIAAASHAVATLPMHRPRETCPGQAVLHAGITYAIRSRYEITCPFFGISLRLLMPFRNFSGPVIRWQRLRSRYEITCPFFGISLRLLMPFPEYLRSRDPLATAEEGEMPSDWSLVPPHFRPVNPHSGRFRPDARILSDHASGKPAH
jgi:hypothetical protein